MKKGDEYQNKHDLTRVIVLEVTDKYFIIGNKGMPSFKPKKFKLRLEKQVFFEHFEPVPKLIKMLD